MKYIQQFAIIALFSLIGEGLHALIPLPVPGSIYGMLLLLIALCLKVVKPAFIKETAGSLIEIMPLLFIPAAVGLLDCWESIQGQLMAILVIIVVSTLLVFCVSGHVTQLLMKKKNEEEHS